MTMRCESLVKAIKRKANAKGFKDFQVGDLVEFSTEIAACGGNRGRTYAVDICIHNKTKDIKTRKTFNQIGMIADCFEWEEL